MYGGIFHVWINCIAMFGCPSVIITKQGENLASHKFDVSENVTVILSLVLIYLNCVVLLTVPKGNVTTVVHGELTLLVKITH